MANVAKIQNAANRAVLAQQLGQRRAIAGCRRAWPIRWRPPGELGLGPGFLRRGAVGYRPMITTLPEGANFSTNAVISADRRYVRVSPSPTFSQITEVNTFNFVTGTGSNTAAVAAAALAAALAAAAVFVSGRRALTTGARSPDATHFVSPAKSRPSRSCARQCRTRPGTMSRSRLSVLPALQTLEGDRAHHGVVGAQLGRGDVQLESRCSRDAAEQPLAQQPVGRDAAADAEHGQPVRSQRQERLGHEGIDDRLLKAGGQVGDLLRRKLDCRRNRACPGRRSRSARPSSGR